MTLQTIADEVGVSRMTVSNAFSRPDQLSSELRDRILRVADDLGYAGPDPSARALARGRTGVVGVLLESPSDAFRDDVAVGFVRATAGALADAGYSLALLHSTAGGDVMPARDVAMDGAIVYACSPSDESVQQLLHRRIPTVRVEGAPIPGVVDVAIDDATGARDAAQHLVELGHRDIAIVTTGFDADGERWDAPHATTLAPIRRRLAGWFAALGPAGVRPRVVGTSATQVDETLQQRIARLLDDPPTAVLAYSDLAALEVLEAARARGIAVPGRLSVVGFDDNPIAERLRPALTTVRQDTQAKGDTAARVLLAQIAGEVVATPEPLPTTLIVRETTAPPAA